MKGLDFLVRPSFVMGIEENMETFRRVLKSKTVREAFENIPQNFYSFAAMIIAIISSSVPAALFLTGWVDMNSYIGLFACKLIYIGAILTVMLGILYFANYAFSHKDKGVKAFLSRHYLVIIAVVIMAWTFISTCITGLNTDTVWGNDIQQEGIMMYISYFILFCCGMMIKESKHKRYVLNWIVIQSLVIMVFLFIQDKFGVRMLTFTSAGNNWRSAVFPHFNHYGYFLVITVLILSGLFLTEKRFPLKLAEASGIAFLSWALIWNTSFGSFLAVILGFVMLVVVFSLCKGKFECSALIPAAVFAAVLIAMALTGQTNVFSDFAQLNHDVGAIATGSSDAAYAGTSRWGLWVSTARCITEKPIFGWGPNGIADIIMAEGGATRTHNEFLQYTAFFGIPWLIAYLVLIFAVFIRGLKHRKALLAEEKIALVAAFGYLVSSFTGVSLYSVAPFLYILLGLGVHHVSENNTGEPVLPGSESGD